MYTNCKRCGRTLKSEESRNRGYGSFCYSKVNETTTNIKIETKDEEEIDGQIDLLEEVKEESVHDD